MSDFSDPTQPSKTILERLQEESMEYFRRSMYRRFQNTALPYEIDEVIDTALAAMYPSTNRDRLKREVVRRMSDRS